MKGAGQKKGTAAAKEGGQEVVAELGEEGDVASGIALGQEELQKMWKQHLARMTPEERADFLKKTTDYGEI